MKKQKILCVVIDQNAEVTVAIDAALRESGFPAQLEFISSAQSLIPVLHEKRPHILFCPQIRADKLRAWLEVLQRHSPDTLLIWISRDEWQGLTTWLLGVESCTLPINDLDYFIQYVDFILHYSALKHEFRHCKHLLGVAELRCHWLVDYSWEPIAYINQGMHVYANHAYISLFGFESLPKVRIVPVNELVDKADLPIFESLYQTALLNNKLSNRVLITLHTLQRQTIRAEVRFIPAVLKGQRCAQLHVKPLEQIQQANTDNRANNPWQEVPESIAQQSSAIGNPFNMATTNTQPAITVAQLNPHVAAERLAKMQMYFRKSMRLVEGMPNLFFAEPGFRQPDGRVTNFSSLTQQLGQTEGRFKLDYWNLGQVIRKLTAQTGKPPSYLIFVSVGEAIFDNENNLNRFKALLKAHVSTSKSLVIALPVKVFTQTNEKALEFLRFLQEAGVYTALDGLTPDASAWNLLKTIKPSVVRLTIHSAKPTRKSYLTHLKQRLQQLSEMKIRVIVNGIDDVNVLKILQNSSATYLQGNLFEAS